MTTITERLAAAGIEVKPLEWVPTYGDQLFASSPYGKYIISQSWFTGRGLFWLRGLSEGNYDTVYDAKAAAQADYTARILSALQVRP